MTTILPITATSQIHTLALDQHTILGTTLGLAKTTNEDRLGYLEKNSTLRICIADGHWGDDAADKIVRYWLDSAMQFPTTHAEAVSASRTIESLLFDAFGHEKMNPDHDRTPEAAFIVIELDQHQLRIISYGDCRLLVARHGAPFYQLPTVATWLGAFSQLGLRDRARIDDALVYNSLDLNPGDTIVLFTDGIDECVYEVPTISPETVAHIASSQPPQQAFDTILKDVFAHGAEDNASLAIISLS